MKAFLSPTTICAVIFLVGTSRIIAQEQQPSTTATGATTTSSSPKEEVGDAAITLPQEVPRKKKHSWDKKFWSFWIPAIALNVADAALTQICVNRPNCREANPLLGKRPSPYLLYGSKAAILGFGLFISHDYRESYDKGWMAPPIILTGLGVAAVTNNAIVLANTGQRSKPQRLSGAISTHLDLSSTVGLQGSLECCTVPNTSAPLRTYFARDAMRSSKVPKLDYELIPSRRN